MAIIRLANSDETPERTVERADLPAFGVIESHHNRVLEVGSQYWGDGDSAYWAICLRDDGTTEQIGYCSTYCPGCYRVCEALVDAPEEALEAYLEVKRRSGETADLMSQGFTSDSQWHTPRRGSFVRVVAGRKVPVGLEGRVFWSGDSRFGLRIGITPSDGAEGVFTSASNLEVLDQPELGIDPCGRAYDLPTPYLPAANRPEPAALTEIALPDARPLFGRTMLAMLAAGDEPVRYWGWAVAPYGNQNGTPQWFALHLQGQSNWSVVRAQARAFEAPDQQVLLSWLTRRSALPEPDYRPAPVPSFCDPRTGDGARFLIEGSYAAVKTPEGISLEIPGLEPAS